MGVHLLTFMQVINDLVNLSLVDRCGFLGKHNYCITWLRITVSRYIISILVLASAYRYIGVSWNKNSQENRLSIRYLCPPISFQIIFIHVLHFWFHVPLFFCCCFFEWPLCSWVFPQKFNYHNYCNLTPAAESYGHFIFTELI